MKIVHLPTGSKFYETPRGLYPSVTSILQATMPAEQSQRLNQWKQRNGSDAENLRQQASDRGKIIHKLIEARLKGEEMECPPDVNGFWNESQKILRAIGEVIAIEQPVYHSQLHYAGTLDLLAYWQGVLTLFDFKTSHREKRSQWLTDAKLQIAAYRGAYERLYDTEIAQGLIVVITPNAVQLFTLEKDELGRCWEEWLIRLEQYRSLELYGQLFAKGN